MCKISDFGLTRDVYIDETYWKKSNGRSKFLPLNTLFKYKRSLPSWSRFNPNGAAGEDLGAVLKPKLDPKLDA